MQIIPEPRLVLRALQIPARLIDVERRHPRNVRRDHSVENLGELRGIGLAPNAAGVAKTVDFIAVVVARREMLRSVGESGVRNPVPVLDAPRAEAYVVPSVRILHADVVCDWKPELVGF